MQVNGILNLDKPPGISSARAVDRVKRLLPRGTKIGHAGTLDPFATGVLLLLIGKATKSCEHLMDAPKQYEATIKFGANTPTDDLDSAEEPVEVRAIPALAQVSAALGAMVGEILQKPPSFSALKIGGQRAYDVARRGQAVELEPRKVRIYSAELLSYEWPLARIRVDCGRGTYIRAMARDLGAALSVGGYLTELRRTRIGAFDVSGALKLHDLTPEMVISQLQPAPA
ncbi:MAG TPA: tRNA pseudouridine(55) synthase TruB [Humisphaera sp.]|jgi:tRNA pseudouridine55 synthase|nr:tRNA pseudouridine(55) synthase TruB [Humisphaera sp.]